MKNIGGIMGLLVLFSISLYSQEVLQPIKIDGKAQGTTYHITYIDAQNRDLKPEIEKILKDFDLSVSTYIPNSIISKINSNQKRVKVDQYFKDCFNKAKEVWKNTDGAFDPTIFPLSNAYGFGPGKKQHLEKNKIDSILKFIGFDLIKLKGNYVVKKDPRVALDFNSFAQGYSVDVVSNFIKSKNISHFIVEIGGEVYCNGKDQLGKSWLVGIEKPVDNKESENALKAIIKLDNLAISTSGNYRKYFKTEDGQKIVHHINPKTGLPTNNNLLSASLIAKECITTDANATGVLVLGLEKAKIYLQKHLEIQAYLIYSDEKGNYQVYETSGFKNLLVETLE